MNTMSDVLKAEQRVRDLIRSVPNPSDDMAQRLAGDVAAQVYHYLAAVAKSEAAIRRAAA